MNLRRTKKFFEEFRSGSARSATCPEELLRFVAEYCFRHFASDLVYVEDSLRGVHASEPLHSDGRLLREFVIAEREGGCSLNGERCEFPVRVHDTHNSPDLLPQTCRRLRKQGVRSLLVVPMYSKGSVSGYLAIASKNESIDWAPEDTLLVQLIAEVIEARLRALPVGSSGVEDELQRRVRLEKACPHLWVRTNSSLRIIEISGSDEILLGFDSGSLLEQRDLWDKILHPDDSRDLARFVRRMGDEPHSFTRELRIRNLRSGRYRWVSLRAWPVESKEEDFRGWDALLVDASQRKQNQEILLSQSRRLEALYTVSRSLQANASPSQLTLKGLNEILRATKADCGFGCFFDQKTGSIEVVASCGLSESYLREVAVVVDAKSLVRFAIENQTGLLIDNIQRDQRAATQVAKLEDLKGTIIAPMMFENEVFGALALFNRKAKSFGSDDLDLLTAAASQIGLASRRAEFFEEQKRQSDWLAALYDLSHSLSELVTPHEVAERALERLRRHVPTQRMWMGMLSESGSHLIAHASYGDDVPANLQFLQLEMRNSDDLMHKVIEEKRAVFIDVSKGPSCSDFRAYIEELGVEYFAVIPMIALGRVVGLLAIEPEPGKEVVLKNKLPLMCNLSNEVAGFMVTRRMEARMAEAEKMRMAGFFAAGVAHNFNNLLQAVMGQASLIEMQSEEGSSLRESAAEIIDSAGRGASLIKQLLGLSHQGPSYRQEFNLASMLRDARELYHTIVGTEVGFELEVVADELLVAADSSQVQQVITNLLVNAKEAISESRDKQISVRARMIKTGSRELPSDLPAGDYIQIRIRDNGRGMSEERQVRCFEPFFTTKDVDSSTGLGLTGSGLGLSTAYSIVKQHGGEVTVESKIGEGSTFSVFLPVSVQGKDGKARLNLEQALAIVFDLDDSVASSLRGTLDSLGLHALIVSDDDRLCKLLREASENGVQSASSVLVFIDADHYGVGLSEFLSKVFEANSQALVVLSSVERQSIYQDFGQHPQIHVVEKPIAISSIKTFLSRVMPRASGLRAQIEVSRENLSPPSEEKTSSSGNFPPKSPIRK